MTESVDSNQRPPSGKLGEEIAPAPRSKAGGRTIHSRRSNLLRMMVLPLVLTAAVILLVFVGREILTRQVHLNAMSGLSEQIKDFCQQEGRLPREKELSQFDLPRRISDSEVHYKTEHVFDDSPADTVLAHTAAKGFRFIGDGHAVLYLGGNVEWVSRQRLKEMLEEQEQRFNATILPTSP